MTPRPPAADTAPPRGLFRSRLRDARIRSKLGLILIIPLVAVIVLAALRLVDSGQRALSAELVRSLAVASAQGSALAHELHNERMAAARLLADPEADTGDFNLQAVRTDQAMAGYAESRAGLDQVPEVVGVRLARIDDHLEALDVIRREVLGEGQVSVSAALLRYGVIVADVLAYQEAVGQVTDDVALAESVRAVAALSKAKIQMAEAQAIAFVALTAGGLAQEQLTAFLATQTGQQEALLSFTQAATAGQLSQVNAALVDRKSVV